MAYIAYWITNHDNDKLPHLEHDAGDEPCLRRIVGEEVVDGAQVYRLLLGWNKFNDLILQPIDIIKWDNYYS